MTVALAPTEGSARPAGVGEKRPPRGGGSGAARGLAPGGLWGLRSARMGGCA